MKRIPGLFVAAALPVVASAHEKWFFDAEPYPILWESVLQPRTLTFVLSVLALTGLLGLLWRKRRRSFLPGPEELGATDVRRASLFALIPLLLGLHLAVPLLVSGVTGHLFSPDNHLHGGQQYWIGVTEAGIALALFYGAMTRLAAIALAVIWVIGLFTAGYEPMMDNVMFPGFAAFFFCVGRGPMAVDRMLFPRLEPSAELMAKGLTFARIGLGLSLVFVAFSEKLANLPLAVAFLGQHNLNFTPFFGIPMSHELFALCAGSVELLAGLLILFGIFPREIALVAWLPINMSLMVFDWPELVGHLPIYAMLAVLVIWTPSDDNQGLWLRALREGPLPVESV